MKAKRTLRSATGKSLGLLVALGTASLAQGQDTTQAASLWSDSLRLEQNSDYAGALDKMAYFAKVSSDIYLIQIRCGWLNYMNKSYDKAVTDYLAAAKIEPTSLTPYLGLMYTYRAAGQTPQALQACRQVLQIDPLNYTATKMLAAISYENGNFTDAAQDYLSLLRTHPEDESLLSGAGWSLLKLNRKAEAKLCFQRLLILSPTYSYAQSGYQAAQGQ